MNLSHLIRNHPAAASFCLAVCLLRLFAPRVKAASTVDVNSATTYWTAINYGSNNPDPSSDQQTGSEEGDIVGNAAHPAAYTAFGDAGTPSTTDGTLAFRMRVGADASPAGFKSAMFVGVDANNDGKLDLFIGVNNSGNANTLALYSPGTGLNNSPSTTTISSALVSYTETSSNYAFAPVTLTLDPTVGTATDIDGKGDNDQFLSFSVPFSDVVAQLGLKGITITQDSPLSYVIATATQANSLNQDLNGVNGGVNSSATFASLGIASTPMTGSGILVPEPGAWIGITLGGLSILRCFRRARTG